MLESIPLACVRARSHLGVGLVALLDLRQSLRLGDRLIVGGFGFTSPATTFTAGRRRWWWWRRQRVRRWRRVCGVAVVAVAVAAAAALWRPALPVDQGRCSLQDGKYLRRPPPEILARLANARATELEFSAAAAAAQPSQAAPVQSGRWPALKTSTSSGSRSKRSAAALGAGTDPPCPGDGRSRRCTPQGPSRPPLRGAGQPEAPTAREGETT